MSDFDESAALEAAAGAGATAILSGMLHTLSEVLGRLDERLGRLEARAVAPPVVVDVERIADTVLQRLSGDATLQRLGYALDDVRGEMARLREADVGPTVEQAVEVATGGLRHALDEALMALGDRNEVHAHGVRETVEQLSAELRRLAEGGDDEPAGPDIGSLVAEMGQGTERALARIHADLRGAMEELSRAVAERQDAIAGAGALDGQAVIERLDAHGAVLERLRAEVAAQAFTLEQLRSDPGEREPVAVAGIDRLEASLARLHAELDDHSAGQVALVDRLVADQTLALSRVGSDVQAAVSAVAAELADRPDPAVLAAEHADALRRALEEAVATLAERQLAANATLYQAVDGLRAELASLAEPGDDADDGAEAVAELLARQAAAARDDLARIETVLRGQVAEVSGRAGSITDVIGRLDGRLHEVVDGVRALSRHLEATASLVPAVEALRAEVDEVRRLSEQPRLRAVNGGNGD